jgi:hypothetical protein
MKTFIDLPFTLPEKLAQAQTKSECLSSHSRNFVWFEDSLSRKVDDDMEGVLDLIEEFSADC